MRISDWSSDVCSADLLHLPFDLIIKVQADGGLLCRPGIAEDGYLRKFASHHCLFGVKGGGRASSAIVAANDPVLVGFKCTGLRRSGCEIGRASCRERVCQYV